LLLISITIKSTSKMNVQINVMPPCLQFKNKLRCHKSQIIGIIIWIGIRMVFPIKLEDGLSTSVLWKPHKLMSIRLKITSNGHKGTRVHATEYEIYVTKYLLVWKKTRAESGNIRNNVFWWLSNSSPCMLLFLHLFDLLGTAVISSS
jgi:hypothetical protein